MNIQNLQVYNLSITDLTTLIADCIKTELQKNNELKKAEQPITTNDLLSRKEVSTMLGVSYTTLFHWNNDRTLPAQKIGNRVYYQKSKIMDRLNKI
ncbi:helix-turn-helix transcriptional regulator [Flavobacterium sp. FlaQc-51]|uniref:helix-turn-helix transcriptional regulator n=1 Tax=Flavobacterium sp. FlaQc-51 TaxID=3374184 RepID=UPI003757E3BB